MQVRVSNVVIRYDDASHGAAPYSLSLRIQSLLLQNGAAPDAAAPGTTALAAAPPGRRSPERAQTVAAGLSPPPAVPAEPAEPLPRHQRSSPAASASTSAAASASAAAASACTSGGWGLQREL